MKDYSVILSSLSIMKIQYTALNRNRSMFFGFRRHVRIFLTIVFGLFSVQLQANDGYETFTNLKEALEHASSFSSSNVRILDLSRQKICGFSQRNLGTRIFRNFETGGKSDHCSSARNKQTEKLKRIIFEW
ncbi:Leucine rich repeat protein [Leptospira interrogans serovar Canicola]|nr:Leucine rich repeat protein [Leptospira interrogans serovar Canicola]